MHYQPDIKLELNCYRRYIRELHDYTDPSLDTGILITSQKQLVILLRAYYKLMCVVLIKEKRSTYFSLPFLEIGESFLEIYLLIK